MNSIVKLLLSSVIVYLLASCSVLTKSQLNVVNSLAVTSDSVSTVPSKIFNSLAEVRLQRGLYYAASLSSPEAHQKEMEALAVSNMKDEKMAPKADVYVRVLESYFRALRSLSSPGRWEAYGVEMRGIGNNVDSVFLKYNAIDVIPDWDEDIYVGIAKISGRYLGYISENYMRVRQAAAVRDFVTTGDTIVAGCVDALVDMLKNKELSELISNEESGLKNNYMAYLRRMESSDVPTKIEYDRAYIESYNKIESSKATRTSCISALRSVKKAHNKLVTELKKRKKINYIYEELIELNTISEKLYDITKELN